MNKNEEITQNDVERLIEWIKNYFEKNPYIKGATIGMSGGKDSLIVAELLKRAIGKEKLFGIIMPNNEMPDIDDAIQTCNLLGIDFEIVNIYPIYNEIINQTKLIMEKENKSVSSVSIINTPPRIRMTMLYSIAASKSHLVPNTSNLSEIMLGYSTKWGDGVGDFAPLANFTKTEVCKIGELLELPHHLVYKTPADGLSGKSDEENLGLTYDEIDNFIRTGEKGKNFEKMLALHKKNEHKINGMTKFIVNKKNYFERKGV